MARIFFRCLAPLLAFILFTHIGTRAAQASATHVSTPFQKNMIKRITFWGEPYPYGYANVTPHRGCWQHKHSGTPTGHHIKRARMCRAR